MMHCAWRFAELNWEHGVTPAHIGVTANDGTVTLTGYVENFAEKHAAEAAASRVNGVKAVADQIEVRPCPETSRSDEDIAATAVERLAWNVAIPSDAVKITVEDGWITLTGEVDWHYQKVAAEQDLRPLHGVVGVTNKITIIAGDRASDISDEIMHALHRSWFFDPKTIDVDVDNGTVRLSGTVRSTHERQVAAATAWSTPGVIDVMNNIQVV